MDHTDVIVIGGGAAGLMCAIEAGKRGRNVTVLERNSVVGRKIKISGGGRCNFTNTQTAPDNFIGNNKHFHKSALSRYTPADFVQLVRAHRVAFHEKKLGQLFCDGSSQEIIDVLLRECCQARVRILTGCSVSEVLKNARFFLQTNSGALSAESLVIATGGLSIPKLGTTDFGYRIARQFGVPIAQIRPGLVPLTFQGDDHRLFKELAGVTVDSIVSYGRTRFRENVLFTHRGLSGPAILQISSYWMPGQSITIDLLPEHPRDIAISPKDLSYLIPRRLAEKWCHLYSSPSDLTPRLRNYSVSPSGTEGFEKAEVTVGGVDTQALSSKTMECRSIPGLYFIGEVVDVTGQLGGFNFQWAWASGFAAGQCV